MWNKPRLEYINRMHRLNYVIEKHPLVFELAKIGHINKMWIDDFVDGNVGIEEALGNIIVDLVVRNKNISIGGDKELPV